MIMETDRISLREAYLAMFEFLDGLYQRTKSDALGSLLGDLSLLPDGKTADPAAWGDWLRCVEKARRDNVDVSLTITPLTKGSYRE
jgi:hypothetical protein